MTETERLEPVAVLDRLDALARQLIARAAPLQFGAAQSHLQRQAVYQLRYRLVVDRAWAAPEDFPDGQERDRFDDHAVQIVAWDGETLAAACRLIAPAPGCRLPTEEAFGIVIEPRGSVAEIGRACVARAYSDHQHRVLLALLAQAWLEMRRRGFTTACGVVSQGAIRLYQRLGLRVARLHPARPRWGEMRVPIRICPWAATDCPTLTTRLLWRDQGSLTLARANDRTNVPSTGTRAPARVARWFAA